MLLTKEFIFHASHFLPNYHGKCENLHGHSYKLLVTIEGPVCDDGLVFDFVQLKNIVKKQVISVLDHHHLNDIIPISSVENIALWVWKQLSDPIHSFPGRNVKLYEVQIWETPTSSALCRDER